MVSTRSKFMLAIGFVFVSVLLLLYLDPLISSSVQHMFVPGLETIGKILSNNGLFLCYGIFLLLFLYAFIKKNQRIKNICVEYLKVQILFSFLLVRLMKIVFGRARPDVGGEFTFFSLEADYNSFPSGHSADALVSGIFLIYLLKHSKYSAYRFLPLVYTIMIALSRIAVNAHFASDVLAGAAIGVFGAYLFISMKFFPKN